MAKLPPEACLRAGGRLVFMLEGGYDAEAVGESVEETFRALVGEPSVEGRRRVQLPHDEPVEEVQALVGELTALHGLR